MKNGQRLEIKIYMKRLIKNDDLKALILVTARKNSKRIKNKNITKGSRSVINVGTRDRDKINGSVKD